MGTMLRVALWSSIAAVLLSSTSARAQSSAPERYRLRNGLDVILEERHATPQVAVQVRYHVGTRDQPPGHTGLAHMSEHLMFQWSRANRRGALGFLDSVGAASSNGITSADATDYFEVVERSSLERVLAFESDRMGFLLDHIDGADLEQQRRVVLRENRDRESWWDVPGLGRVAQSLLYGASHPYQLNAEEPSHVSAITLDEVRWFHQRWYVPSNATLVIVGDFDRATVRSWIDRYFGGLARVARPERVSGVIVAPVRERNVTAYARALEGRVMLMYPTPALYADGDAELDLVSDMLTGHDFALLTQTVAGQGLARAVSTTQSSMQLGSRFTIVADAATGVEGAQVLAAIDRQLDWIKSRPISQSELDGLRAVRLLEMRRAQQSSLYRAVSLAVYASYNDGDPDGFERDVARYRRVTTEGMQRAMQTWLDRNRRVVTTFRRAVYGQAIVVDNVPLGVAQ